MPISSSRRLAILSGVLAFLLAAETSWLVYPFLRDLIIPPEETAAARGRALAIELGCFNCHGPGGTGGVPNPGSEYENVPSFHQGTIMMFAKNDQDLREYILDGAPHSKLGTNSYEQKMSAQAMRMPAYRNVVNEDQVDDMIAYLRSVSELLYPPAGSAEDGAELAYEMGCFSCHGAMGSGGLANPGSLKGYIPGFYGPDFAELVRDDTELRSWIEEGGIPRLNDDPLATFFIERQRIQMPAYKEHLSTEQVDELVAYIRWLADQSWQDQPLNES
jgi:mono/diheme cytochrome c family protein